MQKSVFFSRPAALLLSVLLVLSALLLPAAAENAAVPAPGSLFTFGRYEQDGDPANGPEPIEWLVLEERDGAVLLLSRCTLDAKPYNEKYGDITWERCTLRQWLNHDFTEAAFTERELQAVPETRVDNSAAQGNFRTDGGSDTQDRVFVLSWAEAARFFPDNRSRRSVPTDYAVSRGAHTNSGIRENGRPTGLWWLRSPGNTQYRVCISYSSGALNYTYATKDAGGIRPALWMVPGLYPGV